MRFNGRCKQIVITFICFAIDKNILLIYNINCEKHIVFFNSFSFYFLFPDKALELSEALLLFAEKQDSAELKPSEKVDIQHHD